VIPTARIVRRRWYVALAVPMFMVALVWLAHHASNMANLGGKHNQFSLLWAVVFGFLVWHLVLSWSERPIVVKTRQQQTMLDALSVTVNVPVYNEDPATLKLVLQALLEQTRMPQEIAVVDDGSEHDLSEVRNWFLAQVPTYMALGTVLSWSHTPNRGKRHAQLQTLRDCKSDIFITTDSDTIASRTAIEEGLKPFIDKRVTSVASVILAYNHRSAMVRLTDAWLLTFQVSVRAAMGKLGCVLVNSGNFSLYRTAVIQEAIPAYEHEFFAGNPVQFSDDSLLTLFSHLRGRTVQQPSSFAFTILPETVSHHIRQQLRWMRGSTIRSVWRFRYLPLRGFAYWEHFAAWVNFVLVSFAFIDIIIIGPLVHHGLAPIMAVFAALVAYLTSLRYLTIRRDDQSFRSQFLSWLIAPIMLLWTATVLRPLRIYAILTCKRTGWNTRNTVEVELAN
jgi:hyaluronan synthase